MRPIFGARLDQLKRVHGLSPEYVAYRLVGDLIEFSGSLTFDGDEMASLRGLLGLQDDPTGQRLRDAVTLLVKAQKGSSAGYVPVIGTLAQNIQEEERQRAEAAAQAMRQRQAQTNASWAEKIRSKLGDGWADPEEAAKRQQQAQRDRLAEALRRQAPDGLGDAMKRLGLSAGFTTDDLKAAYREKAKDAHPDTGGSAEAFNQLTKDKEMLEKVATNP